MRNIKRFEDFLDRMQGLLDNAKEQGHLIVRVEDLENTFPELKENEDERIRGAIIDFLKLPHTQFVGKRDYKKWIAWLEKQKIIDVQSLRSGLLRDMAMSLVIFLDENTLGMDMSSMECEDIESAVINSDWLKIYTYMKKKLEKQGEQKPTDKAEPKFKVGDTMRTLQEASNGITSGLPVVVSIDNEYYHCNNETIAIKDQNNYEYPPINKKHDAWSEEDENIRQWIISDIEKLFVLNKKSSFIVNKEINWLKSLKERMNND